MNYNNYNQQGAMNYGGGLQPQQSHSSNQPGVPMAQQQQQQQHSQYAMQQQQQPHHQFQQQSQQHGHGQLQQTYQEVQRQHVPDGQRIAEGHQPTGIASYDASNQSANIAVNTMSDGRPHAAAAPFNQQQQQQHQQQMQPQQETQQMQQQQMQQQQMQQQQMQQQQQQQQDQDQKQSHEQTTSEVVQEKFKGFLKQAKDNLPTSSKKPAGPNLGFQPTAAMAQRHEDSLVSGKRPLYQFQVSPSILH